MDSIEIRVYPHEDDAFSRTVMALANELKPTDPATLEAALRAAYPSVRVSEQSSLASFGDRTVWYVYRDDHALDGRPRQEESPRPGVVEAAG